MPLQNGQFRCASSLALGRFFSGREAKKLHYITPQADPSRCAVAVQWLFQALPGTRSAIEAALIEPLLASPNDKRLFPKRAPDTKTTVEALVSPNHILLLDQLVVGGAGGIRTHDGLSTTPHFECGTFNHSATSPTRTKAVTKDRLPSERGPLSADARLRKPSCARTR